MVTQHFLHDPDLDARVLTIPELGDDAAVMNTDAAIQLARLTDTPAARRIYRSYLKRRRELQRMGRSGEMMRAEAFLAALKDNGINVTEMTLGGDHDG